MLKEVLTFIKHKGWVYAGLLVGIFFCYKTIVIDNNYKLGAIIGLIPLSIVMGAVMFRKTFFTLIVLFVVNYFIMGVNRYISIPIGVVVDTMFALLIASILFRSAYEFIDWKKAWHGLTMICLVWFMYCIFEISNNTTGEAFTDWLQGVRAIAIYPLLTVVFTSILMRKYTDIQWLLIIWGLFTLLAAAKGYWQRNRGFDSAELQWLYLGEGARTHFIHTGIRYFSFFTDAGNFGSNMGFAMVVFSIAIFYVKNNLLKLYFLGVAIAAAYGMVISGTRGSLAVPFAGFAMFVLLSRNWKLFLGMSAFLIGSFFFLNYTDIGNDNRLIARMRSAFNPDDASLQVRLINQRALTTLMDDLPFGVGIGANPEVTEIQSNAWRIVTTPPDSWLVRIWTRTGIIGLVIYLTTWGLILAMGSYILLFKIKNIELRGILTGLLCGTFGMMVSSYGNDFYGQYPSVMLVFGSQALVFIGPYIDKKLEEDPENDVLSFLKKKEHE